MSRDKQFLIEAVREKSLMFGDFVLKSGAKSTFYLNIRKLTLSHYAPLVTRLVLKEMNLMSGGLSSLQAVGGPTLGADPIVSNVVYALANIGKDVNGFLVRKAVKDHGTKELIEGNLNPGDFTVIIEDVTTTGGSAMEAVKAAKDAGAMVMGVVAVLDRGENTKQTFFKEGLNYRAVLTLDDVVTPAEQGKVQAA